MYRRADPNFTEGLYFDVGKKQLLESTGLYGESYAQWTDLDHDVGTAAPSDIKVPFAEEIHGAGISNLTDSTVIALTWQEKKVMTLDRDTLKVVSEIPLWEGVEEGRGITLDPEGRILYVSDGSGTISCVNADTLALERQFKVQNSILE